MKVFILYSTVNRPFGGANQFMRALKDFFAAQGVLTKNIMAADVILLNSHSLGGRHGKVFQLGYLLKALFPRKIFIHRIDGPVQLYGNSSRANVDTNTYLLNEAVADGTIYQSNWSRERNRECGMRSARYETTIYNAADSTFFFPPEHQKSSGPIRLVATSWSNHANKGFDVYKELDRSLDWSRFVMTFVGRAPQSFQNITIHDPVASHELGELLRSHDIFITASINDACSNSLLEALACGLPVVARASGGHPELVGRGGELFEDAAGAVDAIERVAQNIEQYRRLISVDSMDRVGAAYLDFFERIVGDVQAEKYTPKRISIPFALRRIIHG